MKKSLVISLLVSIMFFVMPVFVFAGSAAISWTANSDSDLSGYRIYYGTTKGGPYGSSTAIIPKAQTSYVISDLSSGTYYFVVVAVDTSSNESAYSSEVSKTIASTAASTATTTSTASTTSASATTTAGAASSTTASSNGTSDTAAAKTSTSSSEATSSSNAASATPIPLPASGAFGQVSGNSSQLKKVDFSFPGRAGKVKIYYKGYDIDSSSEVSIIINGTSVGYAKKSKNNKWSKQKSITLKAKYVKNSSTNILTFQSNSSSPDTNPWGVRIIKIK